MARLQTRYCQPFHNIAHGKPSEEKYGLTNDFLKINYLYGTFNAKATTKRDFWPIYFQK